MLCLVRYSEFLNLTIQKTEGMWYAMVIIWLAIGVAVLRRPLPSSKEEMGKRENRIEASVTRKGEADRRVDQQLPPRRANTSGGNNSGDIESYNHDPHTGIKRLMASVRGHKVGGDTPDCVIARRDSYKRISGDISQAHAFLGYTKGDTKE